MIRKSEADYIDLAKRRGFKWVGPKISKVLEKTIWQCANNHQWEARYNDIANGSGALIALASQEKGLQTTTTWQANPGSHGWGQKFTAFLEKPIGGARTAINGKPYLRPWPLWFISRNPLWS